MKYKIGFLCGLILSTYSYADSQYNFDQSSSNQSANQVSVDSDIVINRNFPNMSAVLLKLNNLGFSASIVTPNEFDPQNQNISTSTTIKAFINAAAAKFNYSVVINGSNVVFKGLSPAKPKPVVTPSAPIIKPVVASLLAVESRPVVIKAIPAPQITVNNNWTVNVKDKTLRNTMMRWAKQANYQLEWQVKADFPITSNWTIQGSFESAIAQVLKASRNTDTPIKSQWYSDNKVIVIVPLTNQDSK